MVGNASWDKLLLLCLIFPNAWKTMYIFSLFSGYFAELLPTNE